MSFEALKSAETFKIYTNVDVYIKPNNDDMCFTKTTFDKLLKRNLSVYGRYKKKNLSKEYFSDLVLITRDDKTEMVIQINSADAFNVRDNKSYVCMVNYTSLPVTAYPSKKYMTYCEKKTIMTFKINKNMLLNFTTIECDDDNDEFVTDETMYYISVCVRNQLNDQDVSKLNEIITLLLE